MARVWIDGGEVGDLSHAIGVTLGGRFTNQTSVKRTGGYAYKADLSATSSSAAATFGLAFPAEGSTDVYGDPDEPGILDGGGFGLFTPHLRVYVRVEAYPTTGNQLSLLTLMADSTFVIEEVLMHDAGLLYLVGAGPTASALALNTWYRLEVRIDANTADEELRIDGVTELMGTSGGGNPLAGFVIGDKFNANTGAIVYYDDIALDDNSWLGPGAVKVLRPDGDGTYTDFSNPSGIGADWEQLDEAPPDGLTTDVEALIATAPDVQTITLTSATGAGISSSIKAIRVNATLTPGTGTSGVRLRVRLGSTNYDSGAINVTGLGAFRTLTRHMSIRPSDSGAWTLSNLDGMEAGIEYVGSGQGIALTTLSVEVDYDDTPVGGDPRRGDFFMPMQG